MSAATTTTQLQEDGKQQRSDLHHQQRARSSSTGSEPDGTESTMSLDASLRMKRDSTYYFDDGSCIFLVEDTLFNVRFCYLTMTIWKHIGGVGSSVNTKQGRIKLQYDVLPTSGISGGRGPDGRQPNRSIWRHCDRIPEFPLVPLCSVRKP